MKKFKIFEIIFHILGFPALIAALIGVSIDTFKGGIGYGVPVFAGLIVAVVMALIYYIAYFILTAQEKKRRKALRSRIEAADRNGTPRPSTADPGRRTGIVLAIIVVCCLTGLWVLIDVALPNPIASATSHTVLYEDLADNWQARGDVHVELLEEFITKAYYAGNLKSKSLNEYLKEGITNKEVKELIRIEFESIDKNGYATFIGPPIDLAQNDRMTIPALVHLLLDKREPVSDENGNRLDEKIPLATFTARQVPTSETAITIGENYQYIRSNQKYIFYTGNFEEIGNQTDYLVIFDSNVGYRKIQFLSAKNGESSFIYTFDNNNGTKLVCTEYKLDRVVGVYTAAQTDSGYKFTAVENGEVVEETNYNSLNDIYVEQIAFDWLEGIDVFAMTVDNVIGDTAITPSRWYGTNYVALEKSSVLAYANWNVLDMLGTPMGFALPMDTIRQINISIGPLNITGEKLVTEYAPTINDALATLSALASNEKVLGSDLTISLNFDTGELSLIPCNEARGTLDYMRQAWLYNNGLLYVLVGLFSTRKLFLIFAAVISLLSYLIGVMHELGAQCDEKGSKNGEEIVEHIDDNVVEG